LGPDLYSAIQRTAGPGVKLSVPQLMRKPEIFKAMSIITMLLLHIMKALKPAQSGPTALVQLLLLLALFLPAAPVCGDSSPVSRIIIGGDDNYPPYEYLDEQGRPAGYNVELTRTLMKNLGIDYEIRLGPWGEIRQQLENGEIDLIHGMFYSAERDRVVDFSLPHTYVFHSMFTRRDDPDVRTVEDIRGREIIVMQGDIMHDYAVAQNLTENLILVRDQAEALRLLASGKHDIALVAKLPGLYWIRKLGLDNITAVGDPIEGFPYCYAAREGNRKLLSHVGEELAILNQTGEYSDIYSRWLGFLEPTATGIGRILRYVAAGTVAVLLIILVALFWIWLLRRQVAQKTRQLLEEIESRKRYQQQLLENESKLSQSLALAEQKGNETEQLLEAARSILEQTSFPECAKTIFEAAKKITGARSGYFALLSDDGAENKVLFLDAGGMPCTVDPELPMPIRGLRSEAYRLNRVVYDNDFAASEWMKYLPGGHVRLDNVLFAPLTIAGKVAGIMGLANKPQPFSEHDAAMAGAFGELAAIALRNSRLLEELNATVQAAKNSEERFRIIFQKSPFAIGVSDIASGRMVDVNAKLEEKTGYGREQLLGRTTTEMGFYAAEDRERFIGTLLQNGIVEGLDMKFRTRTEMLDARMFARIVNMNGQDYLLSIFEDVTEVKKAEKARQDVEERLILALSSANQGIWDWDLETGEVVFDSGFYTIAGYDPYEFPEHTDEWENRLHPDDIDKVKHAIDEYLAGRASDYTTQFRFRRRDQSWMWIRSVGRIVERRVDGTPARFIGVHIDITDSKRAEEKIRDSLREKETLLREIHHRVKNNMNVVSSLLSLYKNTTRNEEVKKALQVSQGRVYAMSAVHETLHNSENLAEIDLQAYLTKLSGSLIQTYAVNPGKVKLKVDGDPVKIHIDKASPLGLTVNELISNALKYAFPGDRQGRIEVIIRKRDEHLELVIADDGIGVPHGFAWRNSGSLGLKLVQSLIEKQLGGSLEMESANGTRFRIQIQL